MKQASLFIFLFVVSIESYSQNANESWHGIAREIHYKPDKQDFVLVNGKKRFNRAQLVANRTGFV